MKKYGVDAFPHCVHLVRCAPLRGEHAVLLPRSLLT
jgi:hypothetical protein